VIGAHVDLPALERVDPSLRQRVPDRNPYRRPVRAFDDERPRPSEGLSPDLSVVLGLPSRGVLVRVDGLGLVLSQSHRSQIFTRHAFPVGFEKVWVDTAS